MVIYNKVSLKMENNNKESFKLLDVTSSGSASESVVPEVVLNPRKKKLRRRTRGVRSGQTRQPQNCQRKGQMLGMVTASVLLLCWLLVLTYLAVVLNSELSKLDGTVKQVVAGNQNVPSELQECHSLTRQLQKNQTDLYNQIITLARQLGNFSSKLDEVQAGFHSVREELDGAPELVNIPRTIKELQGSVAGFGSQITDLEATVSELKRQQTNIQEFSKNIAQNLTALRESMNVLSNASQHPDLPSTDGSNEKRLIQEKLNQISKNLTRINETLSKRVEWVTDDQKKDRKRLGALEDSNLDLKARVTTLEENNAKSVSLDVFNNIIANITDMVRNDEKQIHDLDVRVYQLHLQGSELSTNSSRLEKAMETLQSSISPLIEAPASQLSTESALTDQPTTP